MHRGARLAACLLVVAAGRTHAEMPSLSGDGWHRWQVDAAESARGLCCYRTRGGVEFGRVCTLDPDNYFLNAGAEAAGDEGLAVYARIGGGEVRSLRAYSASCPVESADGVRDHGAVATDDSVAWLARLLDDDREIAPEAVMILSMHGGRLALNAVIDTGRTHPDAELRSSAWFWLAESGAPESELEIGRAVREDPDDDVREEAVFALSELPDERAVGALAQLVRNRELPMDIREQALFWLAQSDSDEAVAVFDGILGID